jgi:hypothetical protein
MRTRAPRKQNRPFLARLSIICLLLAALAAYGAQVELATTVEGDLQPTIKGVCNLPTAMKLVVHVTRKETAFDFEAPVEVQAGQFEVGPLLQGTKNLNAGRYQLEIMSAHPSDQPDAVRAVIGQKGQELKGPLTRRYSGATVVRLLSTFEVGHGANAELDQARREQVRLSETRWWRKNCADICAGGQHYAEQKGKDFDQPACFKTCVSNPPTVSR